MNKNIAIILMVVIGAVCFVIGYSVAPTDVATVRHGVTAEAGGGDAGGYGGGDSGGYGAPAAGGYGAPAAGGYGAPAAGGYGM